MTGIIIISISRQPWSANGLREFLGVLLLALANVSRAIGSIIVAKDKNGIHPLILTSAQMALGGLSLLVISIPLEGVPTLHYPLSFYAVFLWLSMISAAAFGLWFTLLKRPGVKVSELSLWVFIIPVCGALLSWMILPDESPELFSVIGMCCVTLSLLFYHLPFSYRKI